MEKGESDLKKIIKSSQKTNRDSEKKTCTSTWKKKFYVLCKYNRTIRRKGDNIYSIVKINNKRRGGKKYKFIKYTKAICESKRPISSG